MPGLEDLKRELPGYLVEMRRRKSQPGKEIIFARFAERVFGISPESIEMEVPVSSKVLLVKGRIDAVFGSIIMEFKVDLERELEDAKIELAKYFQSFAEKYPSRSYIGIAHDGLEFRVFRPVEQEQLNSRRPVITTVEETDYLNLETERDLERIYLWFDSYLFISDRVYPSSKDISRRLGTDSPTFHGIESQFRRYYSVAMKRKRNSLKYENWAKALEVVYGERVEGRDLFIKHTYLATLAKLLVHLVVTKAKTVTKSEIRGIIYGDFFQRYGITNFIEDDFYTWVFEREIRQEAIDVVYSLMQELLVYNLDEVDEDFMKSLYEELVNPEVRHGLGEYYTPDWLAEKMVDSLLLVKPEGSVLDPACGSGTFLFSAIRWKITKLRERGWTSLRILNHLVGSVKGADIHPLAVVVAKTNYLLAIRKLLGEPGRGTIRIPVFLCDTLLIPTAEFEYESNAAVYKIPAPGKSSFSLPEINPKNPEALDLLIEEMGKYAKEYEKRIELNSLEAAKTERTAIEKTFSQHIGQLFSFEENRIPLKNFRTLLDLIEADENSIWIFILKNIYKPVALASEKFDFVIGNPPWIAFRSTHSSYQKFLKPLITEDYQLISGRGELITHLEVGTLFLLRATDLYLREGGKIGFVLPKSVFNVDVHDGLRRGSYILAQNPEENLVIDKVWDCEDVEPLFTISSCVVFGEKTMRRETRYPIEGVTFSGRLPSKNIALKNAQSLVNEKPIKFYLEERGKRSFWATKEGIGATTTSPYQPNFIQGATMVPRTFWFVTLKESALGFDRDFPPIVSAVPAKGGPVKTYQNVRLEGNVETQFLFASVLGDDIVPFGLRNVRLAVVPVVETDGEYHMITADEARKSSRSGLASWLEETEKIWAQKRGAKAERLSIYANLNWANKLTSQQPKARYRVVYPSFQRVSLAAMIETPRVIQMLKEKTNIEVANVVVEHALYRFETDDKQEANYLTSVLNSSVIDGRLGELRRRSQKTHPNVDKKLFDVAPIPRFDREAPNHITLAKLGEVCHTKIADWLSHSDTSTTEALPKIRSEARDVLKGEMKEIDHLTESLLGSA